MLWRCHALSAVASVSVETLVRSDREMSWLVSTAWNRGCRYAKFLMHAQALPFMAAALDLMDTSEAFKENREVNMSMCIECMPCSTRALMHMHQRCAYLACASPMHLRTCQPSRAGYRAQGMLWLTLKHPRKRRLSKAAQGMHTHGDPHGAGDGEEPGGGQG